MKTIKIPYYTSSLDLHVDEKNLEAVITARTDEYEAGKSEEELVKEALEHPIGTPRLSELAKGKNRPSPSYHRGRAAQDVWRVDRRP